MLLAWHMNGWEDYVSWQRDDKRIVKRINQLIEDVLRHPTEGLGKPEPLRHELSGAWSRRITEEHRLVYYVDQETVTIMACKHHYGLSQLRVGNSRAESNRQAVVE